MNRAVRMFALLGLLAPATVLGQQGEGASGSAPDVYRLTLGDAARLAAERGTSVLAARSRAEGADAHIGATTAALLPTVDADVIAGNRTFNVASFGFDFPAAPGEPPLFDPNGEVLGPVRTRDVRARADIPLLDLAAIGRRRTAIADAEAAELGVGAAAETAAATAARAYVEMLRARAELGARQEDLRLAESLLDIARGILESGTGVATDVTRAEAQVVTIRAQLLAAEHRAATAELGLRRVLRLPEGATLQLSDELGSPPAGEVRSEEVAVATALERRSDLRTLLAGEEAALQSASATRAERLPRVSASVDDGFYGSRFDNLLDTYSWTVRVSVPVFHGFSRSSRLREQQARADEIGYRIEALHEDIVFEVRGALLDLDAAREQALAAEERERLVELEVSQEEERVRAGVAGTADLVRAAMSLNQARTARLNAQAAAHLARVALASAIGTGTELP